MSASSNDELSNETPHLIIICLFTVWLTDWSTDSRASDPTDITWRNIYIGVYAALGAAQGSPFFL